MVLFDPSLPGQLLSISLHSGHAVSTKQGGYCTDVQALLGSSQVCDGEDVSLLCDQHLKGLLLINPGLTDLFPLNNLEIESKLFALYYYM